MMNNPWFRIVIEKDPSGNFVTFKHPTQPATAPGGWMEETKRAGGDLADGFWGQKTLNELAEAATPPPQPEQVPMTNPANINRIVEIEELREHQTDPTESCWFVVEDEVYEGAGFLSEHPGGVESITSTAGMDVTEEFVAIHSENARAMMPQYHIGRLSPAAKKALSETVIEEPESDTLLDPRVWQTTKLTKKVSVSHDTRLFQFTFPDPTKELGLPVGQHLMVKLKDSKSNEVIVRAYTPVSRTDVKGTLDLLVKVYFDTEDGPGGKMSQALDAIEIGDDIEVKGPIGKLIYQSRGNLTLNALPRKVKKFHMICGGTGITPIFQVLRAVIEDPEDTTTCTILYGNRQETDILCKDELDALERVDTSGRIKLVHTLSRAPDEWTGVRGRIDRCKMQEYMDLDSGVGRDDELVLLCGPEAMEKDVKKVLKDMGWKDENICVF